MNFKHATISILLFWSALATGAAPSVPFISSAQCPAIGEEFAALIAKLDAIKASVKEGANCSNVALKVKSLEDLLVNDRTKILEIVEAGRTQPLTPQQTDQVREYAENVTTKVAGLYDLISNSNKCFQDEKSDASMANLAGFVGEASRLIAGLSGPWGTPIALAGNVAAGFLTGLDKVIKTRAGYDFKKRESWINYVQNLCTYYGYRDQIEHLLDPQGRIAQLNSIKGVLDVNIQKMSDSCGSCESSEVLGSYMAYNVGVRNWVTSEIQRVQKESASFWADISGRHVLTQVRNDLQQFLVEREGPRFISYQTGLTATLVNDMQFKTEYEGRALYDQLYRANHDAVTGKLNYYFSGFMEFFRALVIQPVKWEKLPDNDSTEELKYSWTAYRDRTLTYFRSSEASLHVAQGFCQFFRQAGLYSPQIRSACTSSQARNSAETIGSLGQELTNAKVIGNSLINPSAFDPGYATKRIPRTQIEVLSKWVEMLTPR